VRWKPVMEMNGEREALQSEIATTMDVVKAELAGMKADILKWLFVALAIILVSAFVWFVKRMFQ
jgi:flagellar biogenesis protein FliO